MSPVPVPRAAILGLGAYAPEQRVTNADLEKLVDTSDAWIVERSGIRQRRRAAPHQAASDLGLEAARLALADARCRPEDLEAIYVGTASSDYPFPSTACVMQAQLGCVGGAAFDLTAACAGFLYTVALANDSIAAGRFQRVLCVGTEVLTRMTDYNDRGTCILFGDAAGAVVLGPADAPGGHRILHTRIHADGRQVLLLHQPAGGSRNPASHASVDAHDHSIRMEGREVYKFAVRTLPEAVERLLSEAGVKGSDVRWLVPHQMNVRIMEAVGERLGIPMDRTMVNIDRYGNTSSASIPLVLNEYVQAGKVKKGDLLALVTLGGGLAWATALVEW